ncbi:hypothetical protein QOZ95_000633 [Paenibacillus brasilensis]|uniref:Uncharacterized protein n=1 Tax=Paenibacillus brasilensis TaxID=128574 RepID=A0ABU0KSS2_9BACL|nr:hypothetical protein [Paenibacillus brasilensis]
MRAYRVVVWLTHRLIVGSVSAAELHGLHGLLKKCLEEVDTMRI